MKNTEETKSFHGQQNNFIHVFSDMCFARRNIPLLSPPARHPVYRRGNKVRSLFIARPVYSAFNLHRDKYRLAETTDLCPLADRKGEKSTGTDGCRGGGGGGGGRDESKEIQRPVEIDQYFVRTQRKKKDLTIDSLIARINCTWNSSIPLRHCRTHSNLNLARLPRIPFYINIYF